VRWEPFILRPGIPEEGRQKAPDTPDNPRVGRRLRQAGEEVGLNFTGLCDRSPNSTKAHALLKYAAHNKPEVQHELSGLLFKMYFEEGDYPDVENLVKRAVQVGLDGESVRQHLESRKDEKQVLAEARAYSSQGVNGVPFFIMNGKPMFSGAQREDTFLKAFKIATE